MKPPNSIFGSALYKGLLRLCCLLVLFSSLSNVAYAQLPKGFVQKKLSGDDIKEATSMAHAADGRIFIAERSGAVKVFQNGTISTVYTATTTTQAEQGLLGITLHPDFANNGKCYIYYTNKELTVHYLDVLVITKNNTVSSATRLMQFDPILNGAHNGGAILFKKGLLYIAIGESETAEESPKLNTYRGKVLRLNDDGTPAEGNPYYDTPGASRQQRSIWASGLRNPWKMTLDPLSQRIFVIDVGGNYEEVNDVTNPDPSKNYNYGWDQKGQSGNEQGATTIPAYFYYNHDNGCAITSGMFFNPPTTNYPAEFRNRFYYSDWCSGWFKSIDVSKPQAPTTAQDFATDGFGSILGTSVGVDGNIYYIKYADRGSLWRVEYNNGEFPSIVNQPVNTSVFSGDDVNLTVSASGGIPLTYQWKKNDVDIAGATSTTLSLKNVKGTDAGQYSCLVTNSLGSTLSDKITLTVKPFNAKPIAKILAPTGSTKWSVGDKVPFSGTGNDQEDGVLPASAFHWDVHFYHKENANSEHWHPGPLIPEGIDAGTFTADNNGEPSPNVWLRVYLTVTDKDGRKGVDSVDIQPNKVLLTMTSNVPGLSVVMNTQGVVPFTKTFVANNNITLQGLSPQVLGDSTYEFNRWEHGGDVNQSLRVPAANTTYKAIYAKGTALQNPFYGVPAAIPGKIEAEDFDKGGEGIAYHDTGVGNQAKGYRPNEDVDIEKCAEDGYNIAYVDAGEWLEYTVNVTQAGKYDFTARLATNAAGKKFHIEIDGVNVSGSLTVPLTGGFQAWKDYTITTPPLTLGVKVVRIFFETTDINLNYFTFKLSDGSSKNAPVVSLTSPADQAKFANNTDINITADAVDNDGRVVKVEFFRDSTKLGESLTSPYQYTWKGAAAGTYSITAKATDDSGLTTTSSPVSITVKAPAGPSGKAPYSGTPALIPGKIEAEDFDKGGEGVGYHDLSLENQGNQYRLDEGVDIEGCAEGGYNIGYVNQGEWLEYTINVSKAGKYTFEPRIAANGDGKTFHIEMDGKNISGPIAVPNTGGFQAWQSLSITTPVITSGVKVLRVVMDSNDINFNYFTFNYSKIQPSSPTVSITAPVDQATFDNKSDILFKADAADQDGSVTKVEFFQDTTKIGESVTSPFQYNWAAVAAGTYKITAKATNDSGLSTTSAAVSITVKTAAPTNGKAPYSGTPALIPGKIEAEDFDKGGEGVGYHDLSPENQGNQYRLTEGVDIEGCTEGGYNIGYVNQGEWLEYTVNVSKAGSYSFAARVATNGAGKTFHIEMDGVNISGPVAVPNTGGFQAWQTVSVITPALTTGTKVLRVVMDSNDINFNYYTFTPSDAVPINPTVSLTAPADQATFDNQSDVLITADAADADGTVAKVEFFQRTTKIGEAVTSPYQFTWTAVAEGAYSITAKATDNSGLSTTSTAVNITVKKAVPAVKAPFYGTPAAVPGKIEAEDFDKGGEGLGYHDFTPENQGRAYRPNEGVDLEGCSEGGFNIGYVVNGEWTEYTIDVKTAGKYTIDTRVASNDAGKTFHFELDGKDITGPVSVPKTGGFQAWQTASVQTSKITAGTHVLRMVMDANDININYFTLTNIPLISPTVSITTPADQSSYFENADVDIAVNAADADGTVTKVEYFQGTTKIGESTVAPFNITWSGVAKGTYTITAVATDDDGLSTTSSPIAIVVNAVVPANGTAYSGTPIALPGKVEAENYNIGGEGVAYHDSTTGNAGKSFRPNEDVDTEGCTDGGYNVAYITSGEWLAYTVNVTQAGKYKVLARVAANNAGKTFHLELNGKDISGPIAVPNTGGYQAWQTVVVTTPELKTGVQTLRAVMDSGDFNLNYLSFIDGNATAPTVFLASPAANSTYKSKETISISANATDADGTIAKIELFQNGKKLGEGTKSHYQYNWAKVTSGNYVITAVATDNDGLTSTSAPVSISVDVPVFVQKNIPGKFQAEDFDDMKGIQVENTADDGGGENIGYVDNGDWMDYKVTVAKAGKYTVNLRVASNPGGGKIQLLSGSNVLTTVDIAATGGWQAWTTVSTEVTLAVGDQTIRVLAANGNWNLNWIEFANATFQASGLMKTSPTLNQFKPDDQGVKLYPNPVDNSFTVKGVDFDAVFTIINLKTMGVIRLKSSKGFVNVSNLQPGNYNLQFKNVENKNVSINFIKL